MYQTHKTSHQESRSVAVCFLFLDGPASSLLAILKTFQLADCAGLLWMLRVDRFAAHVALASTKNRYYSIAWLRPSFFLSLYCSQWKRRSRDSLETDKMSGRFWVFVSGRFCDRTEEREKLRRAEDLPPKTEGLAPLCMVFSEVHCKGSATPTLVFSLPPSISQSINKLLRNTTSILYWVWMFGLWYVALSGAHG